MISKEMTDLMKGLKKFQTNILKRLDFERIDPVKWRQAEDLLSVPKPVPEGVEWQQVDANGVTCEWILTPNIQSDLVVFYIHGGSYCAGSIAKSRAGLAYLSRALNIRVFSVEYRLSPEHPYPEGLNDCLNAYKWIISVGEVDPSNIIIYGSSAGGGLALATLVKLRDEGISLPTASILLSPWLDLTLSGDSVKTKADEDPVLNERFMKVAAKWYYSDNDPRDPLISPVFADVKGLPPLFIQVGSAEILLDDSTCLAEKAKKAGVDVHLEIWEDLPHSFNGFDYKIPEVKEGNEQIREFIKKYV